MDIREKLSNKVHGISREIMILLLAEQLRLCRENLKSVLDVEHSLSNLGKIIGKQLLEIFFFTKKKEKREIEFIPILTMIHSEIWKEFFGYIPEPLEKGIKNPNEYMIIDLEPVASVYADIPVEYGDLSPSSWIAGIIEGIITSLKLKCEVTAHNAPIKDYPYRTIFLIKKLDREE